MIKQECIGIPDMILLLMIFFVSKKIKIKAEIVLSPGGAYFEKSDCKSAEGKKISQAKDMEKILFQQKWSIELLKCRSSSLHFNYLF